MKVRQARRGDVPAVLDFLARAAEVPGVRDEPARVEALVDAPHAWLLVAEDGGSIVGAIVAGWDGWRGSLYRLAVAPERRGNGIARTLVAEAERLLRDAGAPRIGALAISEDARAFWERIGYELDTRVVRYIKNSENDGADLP